MKTRPQADIILVATETVDRVPLPDGTHLCLPGGPATYVGDALKALNLRYQLITGERAIVDVLLGEGGEEYVIPALPFIELPATLAASAVMLSPIIREIDPDSFPTVKGLLVVDLQGFVREPSRATGSVTRTFDLAALIERADVVKGASEELERLSPTSAAALAGRLVLETRGVRGALLHADGRTEHIPVHPVEVTDTIGAGDTFLAAFVAAMVGGDSPMGSATSAARFTERWLEATKSPSRGRTVREG